MKRESSEPSMSRRDAVGALGVVAATSFLRPAAELAGSGRINQSVCRWCYSRIPLDDLCRAAKSYGYKSVELLNESEWATARTHGLDCAMASSFGSIPVGFNRPDHHDKLVADGERLIAAAGAAKIPAIVVFSGNKAGMSDGEGIANCVTGLKRLMPAAERHGVTLCMEMLNSKVDHKDYHADHTAWAVEVAKGVGSQRFKLLYDIYHMQIMEGDVIRTIRDNAPFIAHYHTAGVPGRNEIDASQELNYPRIMTAIADLGYGGYVGQEFIPKRDPITSLGEGYRICDI